MVTGHISPNKKKKSVFFYVPLSLFAAFYMFLGLKRREQTTIAKEGKKGCHFISSYVFLFFLLFFIHYIISALINKILSYLLN